MSKNNQEGHRLSKILEFLPVLFLGLIVLAATGCNEIEAPPQPQPELAIEQPFLFDVYNVNFSWGYTLTGTYIDGQGNVIRYDHSFEQWTAASFDSLTLAELEEKFIAPVDTLGRLDPVTLGLMYDKIDPASLGELSERVFMGADMGGSTSICYKYDENSDRYLKVLLLLRGSYWQSNLSEAGIELHEMLSTQLSELQEGQ